VLEEIIGSQSSWKALHHVIHPLEGCSALELLRPVTIETKYAHRKT
jgi:hypothetical protein